VVVMLGKCWSEHCKNRKEREELQAGTFVHALFGIQSIRFNTPPHHTPAVYNDLLETPRTEELVGVDEIEMAWEQYE
jgi:hypothetical protein